MFLFEIIFFPNLMDVWEQKSDPRNSHMWQDENCPFISSNESKLVVSLIHLYFLFNQNQAGGAITEAVVCMNVRTPSHVCKVL